MKTPLLSRDQRLSILIWISIAFCYLTYKEIAAFYYPTSNIIFQYDTLSSPSMDSLHFQNNKTLPFNEQIKIELNSADSNDLNRLKIPSYLIPKILTYRDQLGGFSNSFQLLEIYHFPESVFERIHPSIHINLNLIQPIGLNHKTEEELALHPYLSYKEAKAIVLFRKNNGHIKNLDDFNKIIAISEDAKERLKPYLAKDFQSYANTSEQSP
jgi:DNA uptake protein ComE-like DNA-binding protein